MKNKDNRNNSVNYIQFELKEILGTFVNGGFSSAGYALYPLVRGVSPSLAERLMALVYFVKSKNKAYELDFSNSLDKFRDFSGNVSNAKNFAMVLSELYEDFDKNKSAVNAKAVNAKPNCLKEKDYKDDYLKPVLELKKFSEDNLKDYLIDIHVHGSLATLDYVEGWSDFDTLAIIRKDAIADSSKLLKLRGMLYKSRKYFYKIDPLQHHGHLIFTEHDFDYYCQTFFPIALFKYSKSLFSAKKFKFKLRDCDDENIKKFKWFVDYFKNTASNDSNLMNSYDLKFFLHAVTLFPAMYLQAKGLHMYKKFSFDIAKKDFGEEEWNAIDCVSSLRKNWESPKKFSLIMPYAEINPLLAYQLNSKLLDIIFNIAKQNRIDIKKIANGMKILADSAEKKISAKYG